MKQIKSAALGKMDRALGLAGKGADKTELLDGEVHQTMDVARIARRSLTLAGSEGIFTAVWRNIHGASGEIFTNLQPYEPNDTLPNIIAPYPAIVSPDFDLWLLSAFVERISGTGTCEAMLAIQYLQQGFGMDNLGAAVVDNLNQIVARWDTVVETQTSTEYMTNVASGEVEKVLNRRLPRHGAPSLAMIFVTEASAAATYELQCVLGMFPAAMGQDAFG